MSGNSCPNQSIRLFWWSPPRDGRVWSRFLFEHGRSLPGMVWYGARGIRNFGDELSPLVLEVATGRRVVWSPPERAEVFGVGSILQLASRQPDAKIWGSGLRSPSANGLKVASDRILAVRGPLTRSVVGADCALGDPGLLVRSITSRARRRRGTVFIPHFSAFGHLRDLPHIRHAASLGWKIVPPMSPVADVLDAIGGADCVISSSLHGIVVAQALDVPSVLVSLGTSTEPSFKYEDHYAAVGSPNSTPTPLTRIFDEGLEKFLCDARSQVEADSYFIDSLVQGLTTAAERLS